MDYLNITVIKNGTDEDFQKSKDDNTFILQPHEKVRVRNLVHNHYCTKLSPRFTIGKQRKRPNVLIVAEDAECKLHKNKRRKFEHELVQMNPMFNIAIIEDKLILQGIDIPYTIINIKTGKIAYVN